VGDKTVEHLVLSGATIGVSLLIAIPLGVWLGHLHRGSFLAITVGNLGRALPSLALIAFGLPLFGISFTNVLVALVVLAVPPMLTNAYTGIDEVDRDAVDAARGMGMSGWQVLTRIELPLALPLLFAGIRTSCVYVIATATIAAIAGGGGLGDIIVDQATYRLEGVVGAALCVSLLALFVDALLALAQRAVTPVGLRLGNAALPEAVAPGAGS
jgi:osmoprotectant transport system permease protein